MIEFEENVKYGYGVRKSIVFYFYDLLDSKKIEVIENIIETFIEQFQVKFNKKMVIDEDRYRNIRGGWQKLFHKVFDDGDFAHHAHILDLLEVEEEQLPTHRAYMLLWVDYYLPSSIIFQCTQQTDWKQIYHFMEYVNEQIEVHFASAGYPLKKLKSGIDSAGEKAYYDNKKWVFTVQCFHSSGLLVSFFIARMS